MKRSFGGLLCLVLGVVLLVTGLRTSATGDVGNLPTPCTTLNIGTVVPCPTGSITISEQTHVTVTGGAHAPTPPANWTVHITSACDDPNSGVPVSQDVTVPNNGTGTSSTLFVFSVTGYTSLCSYTLTETGAPAGYVPSFTPASPVTITWNNQSAGSDRAVALVNALTVTSPTPTPTPTRTRTATATAEPTSTATASSSAAPVANTGPHEQVRATAWIGGALCVLGLVLLIAARRPRGVRE